MSTKESKAEAQHRVQGWHDGYAGRPARRKDAVYQQAWRRGIEARQADEPSWRYTR